MKQVEIGERMAAVETKIDSIHEDVLEIKQSLKTLDTRFSGKWVEKVMYALIPTIIGAVITLIVVVS